MEGQSTTSRPYAISPPGICGTTRTMTTTEPTIKTPTRPARKPDQIPWAGASASASDVPAPREKKANQNIRLAARAASTVKPCCAF